MADKKIIAATIQVETDAAQKNVLKLQGNVDDLKKAFKQAAAGSDEQLAALKKLQAAEKDLAKAQDELSSANEKSAGGFSKIKQGLSELPGAAGAAGKGVQGLGAQFKALLANPIVLLIAAIVAGLTLLYKAFTNTFEGGQKMEQVFAGIKAAGQALFDNLGKIGSAIVKFFSFDFSGAVNEIKGVVNAAGSAYTAMAKLTKQAQDLAREQADNDLDQAKRQAKLAELKAKAADGDISAAERKKAAKELLEESKKNAAEDLDLAKRTAENKIAQLTLEKDGAKKNYVEIQKIKAEQIQGETENSNELKQIAKQVTAAEKEEQAKRKEAAQKAAEEEKKRRQELVEFTNKLTKLQQDNELALIKDGYAKELKQLENRIADEKRQNELSFKDKKINGDQLNQLNAALDIQANIQRDAIEEKHQKDIKTKEEAFQKELGDINTKIRLAGIKDARQLELTQLDITHQEKLAKAIKDYKDDAIKLAEIQGKIDEEYRVEKAAKEAKYKEEDDKKKLELDVQAQEKIINDADASFDAKRAAVDQEQILFKEAFDKKLITEKEYNADVEALSEKRKKITELETAHRKAQAEEAAGTLTKLADLVGKQTVAGKALGIAAALINTYQGASEALKQKSTLPSPFDVVAKVVNVATVIATGLKTVKAITAVQVPGGGGSGAGVSAPAITAPAAPIAPTQTSTSLDQDTVNNIGNAAAGGVNGIRAYVVEQDSKEAAARAARLQGAAVLGG